MTARVAPADSSTRAERALAMVGSRPFRFLLAGIANTAFGLAIYPLLLWAVPWLRVHYLVALGIAQVVSPLFAYTTYKLAVFRTRAGGAREAGLFGTFYLVASLLNWLALPLLVEGAGLPPIVAQVGFSLALMVSSYFWHSRVTFRSAKLTDGQ